MNKKMNKNQKAFDEFIETQRGDVTREQFIEYALPQLCVNNEKLYGEQKLTADIKLHESLVGFIVDRMKKIDKIIYFENGIFYAHSDNHKPSNLIGLCQNGDPFDDEEDYGRHGIRQQSIYLPSFQIETLLIIKNILENGDFYYVDANESKILLNS